MRNRLFAVVFAAIIMMIAFAAYGQPPWQHEHDDDEPTVVNEYVTNVYETYEVTETIYATEEQVSSALEAINPTTYTDYSPDRCQGVPEAQAAANNQMYAGTKKPQLSLGAGVCGEAWATSLMFGMRINNNMMLNGSWGHNYNHEIDSAGVGLLVIFK